MATSGKSTQKTPWLSASLKGTPLTVTFTEGQGRILGYIAFKPGWIDQLYVAPEAQGRGVGPDLLAKALEDGSERRLWSFQKNARARAFYEQRGFQIETMTDGQDNEEREPDVLYVWRGENPAS